MCVFFFFVCESGFRKCLVISRFLMDGVSSLPVF